MKQILFSIIVLLIFSSCDDKLDVNDTYRTYPVVYSLLDRNAGVQYVKLNKTFLGDASVSDMASVSDSLYFSQADVYISKYQENALIQTWKLEAVDTIAKDEGFFANDKNIIYVLNDSIFHYKDKTEGYTFKLKVDIPGFDEIKSETVAIDNVRINSPLAGIVADVTLYAFGGYMNPVYSFTAKNNSRFFEIYLEIYYYENVNGEYILRTIRKKQESKKANVTNSEQNTLYFTLNAANFYGLIANSVPKNDNQKIFYGFRYLIYAAGSELSMYIDLTSEDYGIAQEKPSYTNIENGWGLFSSRSSKYSPYKKLNNGSLEYLQNYEGTKDLHFLNSNNTITFYGVNEQYDFAGIY